MHLLQKTLSPNSKVYAFEPVQRVFNKLKENVQLNKFDITCVKKALSNKNGSAIIYDDNAEHIYSVTVNKNMFPADTKVIETKIETITLNSFIKQNNITNIDLLKIDVETHEPEVLEGFSEYLAIFQPSILIEVLNDEVGQRIADIVKGLGYLFFNIDENHGIRQVSHITKSDNFNYLLCNENIAKRLKLVS